MKWFFGAIEELLPVIVFFVVQQGVGFQTGLIAMTGVLGVLLVAAFLLRQPVPRFAIMSTVFFLLFAIPSIVTGNTTYFQISDTILDGTFALLLLGGWAVGYPVLKFFFNSIFAISDKGWHTLGLRWGVLFLALALLNEYIRQVHSEDMWSYYKLVSTIFMILFGGYQFTLSARERIEGESNWIGLRK